MKIGATIADNPRINQRLNILEPITLPTDNDQLQFNAAIQERNNSGAEVPIARIVSPISNADTLKYCATLTEVLIRWFAENHKKNSQRINRMIAKIIIEIFE